MNDCMEVDVKSEEVDAKQLESLQACWELPATYHLIRKFGLYLKIPNSVVRDLVHFESVMLNCSSHDSKSVLVVLFCRLLGLSPPKSDDKYDTWMRPLRNYITSRTDVFEEFIRESAQVIKELRIKENVQFKKSLSMKTEAESDSHQINLKDKMNKENEVGAENEGVKREEREENGEEDEEEEEEEDDNDDEEDDGDDEEHDRKAVLELFGDVPLDWIGLEALGPILRCRLLYTLCDSVCTDSYLVSEALRTMEPDELRLDPVGYDSRGSAYYLFGADHRLYREVDLTEQVARQRRMEDDRKRKEREERKRKQRQIEIEREKKRQKRDSRWAPRVAVSRVTRASAASESGFLKPETVVKEAENDAEHDHCTDEAAENEINRADAFWEKMDDDVNRWKIVAHNAEDLREIADSLSTSRNRYDKHLRKVLSTELIPLWEEAERKEERDREKKERVEMMEKTVKRSARVLMLESKRAEEEAVSRKREEEERRRAAEEKKLVAQRMAEIDRLQRGSAHQDSFELMKATSTRRRSALEAKEHEHEQNGDAATTTEPIVPLTSLEIEEQDCPVGMNWLMNDDGLPTRVLDRFSIVDGKTGAPSQLERIDELKPGESSGLKASGLVIPPSVLGSDDHTCVLPSILHLGEVIEWCIDYGVEPAVFFKTRFAWYRLRNPSPEYFRAFNSTKRKFELCVRIFILCSQLPMQQATYETIVSLLEHPYMAMRGYSNAEVDDEAPFIVEQLSTVGTKRIRKTSAFSKLLRIAKKKDPQRIEKVLQVLQSEAKQRPPRGKKEEQKQEHSQIIQAPRVVSVDQSVQQSNLQQPGELKPSFQQQSVKEPSLQQPSANQPSAQEPRGKLPIEPHPMEKLNALVAASEKAIPTPVVVPVESNEQLKSERRPMERIVANEKAPVSKAVANGVSADDPSISNPDALHAMEKVSSAGLFPHQTTTNDDPVKHPNQLES